MNLDAYRVSGNESDELLEQLYTMVKDTTDNFTAIPVDYSPEDSDDRTFVSNALVRGVWNALVAHAPDLERAYEDEAKAYRKLQDIIYNTCSYFADPHATRLEADFATTDAWQRSEREGYATAAIVEKILASEGNPPLSLRTDLTEFLDGTYQAWVAPLQEGNFDTEGSDGDEWKRAMRAFIEGDEDTPPSWEPMDQLFASQGYTVADLRDENKVSGSKFLRSVLRELGEDCGPVFLVARVSLPSSGVYLFFDAQQATMTLPARHTSVGFFDPVLGGGSLFAIDLERPWTVTFDLWDPYGNAIQIDDPDVGCYGHAPSEVYGFTEDDYGEPSQWEVH